MMKALNEQKKSVSVAEMADKHLKILAIAVFITALKYSVTAAMSLVSDEVSAVLKHVELGIQLLAVVLILYILFWKFRHLTKAQRKNYFNSESYAVSIFNLAMQKTLAITFVTVIFLEAFSRKSNLPPEFFLNVVISLMLTVLSVVFFYKIKPASEALND